MEKIHKSRSEFPPIVLLCHPYNVALTTMYPWTKLQEKESQERQLLCKYSISTYFQLAKSTCKGPWEM